MVVFITYFWRKSVSWDKNEKHLTKLNVKGNHWVGVNSKNEKHFLGDLIYKRELLQALTEAEIKRCFEK